MPYLTQITSARNWKTSTSCPTTVDARGGVQRQAAGCEGRQDWGYRQAADRLWVSPIHIRLPLRRLPGALMSRAHGEPMVDELDLFVAAMPSIAKEVEQQEVVKTAPHSTQSLDEAARKPCCAGSRELSKPVGDRSQDRGSGAAGPRYRFVPNHGLDSSASLSAGSPRGARSATAATRGLLRGKPWAFGSMSVTLGYTTVTGRGQGNQGFSR